MSGDLGFNLQHLGLLIFNSSNVSGGEIGVRAMARLRAWVATLNFSFHTRASIPSTLSPLACFSSGDIEQQSAESHNIRMGRDPSVYLLVFLFLFFFSIIVYHRILSIVPCALQ